MFSALRGLRFRCTDTMLGRPTSSDLPNLSRSIHAFARSVYGSRVFLDVGPTLRASCPAKSVVPIGIQALPSKTLSLPRACGRRCRCMCVCVSAVRTFRSHSLQWRTRTRFCRTPFPQLGEPAVRPTPAGWGGCDQGMTSNLVDSAKSRSGSAGASAHPRSKSVFDRARTHARSVLSLAALDLTIASSSKAGDMSTSCVLHWRACVHVPWCPGPREVCDNTRPPVGNCRQFHPLSTPSGRAGSCSPQISSALLLNAAGVF